jgi:hypothetical protein
MRADRLPTIAIRSISVSVICPGLCARVLRRKHGFETSEAANKYCDTAFDHAPQSKPRDLGVNALSISHDDTGDSNTDDEQAETEHCIQSEFLLCGDFDTCNDRDRQCDYYHQVSVCKKQVCLPLELTAKIRYNIDCGAQAKTDQGQSGVFWSATLTCSSQHRPQVWLCENLPMVNEVHDKGYEMMLPAKASAVIAVITHHALRGQLKRFVSWKKNARKDALTLHRQVQNSTVDANWHLR